MIKSFVTTLSISETNILPIFNAHFDADYREIIDDTLICHNPNEFGISFVSARFLILKSDEPEQPDLINDAKALGDHPNIKNKKIAHFFQLIQLIGFIIKI